MNSINIDISGNSAIGEKEVNINLEYYRKLVKKLCDMRQYQTALFWAEKVACLSLNEPMDVYYKANCMFLLKQYHRAAHTIRFHKLENTNIICYNLLLHCLYEAKEYKEAIGVIDFVEIEFLASSLLNQSLDGQSQKSFGIDEKECNKNEILASINLLKGKIYEAIDNRSVAMDCYVQSLYNSVYCYEALECLVQHEMLTAWEEKELIRQLPLKHQSSEVEGKFITKLYETKLKKYYETMEPLKKGDQTILKNMKIIKELSEKIEKLRSSEASIHKNVISKLSTPFYKIFEDIKDFTFSFQFSLTRASSHSSVLQRSVFESPNHNSTGVICASNTGLALSTCLARLHKSTDVMGAQAERLFYDCEYKKAFKIINELLKIDPYDKVALTVQIGCLIEFGDYNKLFYMAHKLVDHYPDDAISWYAVGCYNDLIGKNDLARSYFAKSTSLNRLYAPAWLAYGHSLAKEDEHDPAIAAYFKAMQIMRGCHLPLLYIGVEYGLTENLELAEKFLYQAMSIAPLDVSVLHELAVINYKCERYETAEEIFRTTVDIISHRAKQNKEQISVRWEPMFNNLGHCCRKNKRYKEALKYHQFALLLKPQTPRTFSAIGFVHALMGNLEEATVCFHKSLALNHECIVTSTILKTCIEDLMNDDSIIEEICGRTNLKSKVFKVDIVEEDLASPMKFECKGDVSKNGDDVDATNRCSKNK
uniref:Uncharacterized protein n=1 Tax=Glossina brevipalpis TaxID=37001 RepID=A0A1A9X1T1_9MUSC